MNCLAGASFKNMEQVLNRHNEHTGMLVFQVAAAVVMTVAVSLVTRRELKRMHKQVSLARQAVPTPGSPDAHQHQLHSEQTAVVMS